MKPDAYPMARKAVNDVASDDDVFAANGDA
jgi:hypothetical protein